MTTDFTLDKFTQEQKYRVLFEGKIKEHVTPEEARQNVAALLKLDPQKTEQFFSGQTVTLKTNITFEEADRLKGIFDRTGALCVVRSMEDVGDRVYVPETPPTPEAAHEEEPEPQEAPTMYSEEAPPELAPSPYLDDGPDAQESRTKSLVPLVVAVLIIISLVYFLVLRKKPPAQKTEAEFHQATVVKLTYLNSLMQVAITLTLSNEISFPADLDDIETLIKEQASLMPKEAIRQGNELLVDGWGDEMIYQHKGNTSYIIRSAGPDGIFETEDDLTLTDGKIEEGRGPDSLDENSPDQSGETP